MEDRNRRGWGWKDDDMEVNMATRNCHLPCFGRQGLNGNGRNGKEENNVIVEGAFATSDLYI